MRRHATVHNLESLTGALVEARTRFPDQGVLIRGDAALPYQHLADVLSACDAAGIRNVRLPVRAREADAKPSSP
ncbi:MAG: biopolymer transporter ExbD [Planctomycetota bacterium]|nr:biopolymer transporter ExbD [Planctomycetota bacterium]